MVAAFSCLKFLKLPQRSSDMKSISRTSSCLNWMKQNPTCSRQWNSTMWLFHPFTACSRKLWMDGIATCRPLTNPCSKIANSVFIFATFCKARNFCAYPHKIRKFWQNSAKSLAILFKLRTTWILEFCKICQLFGIFVKCFVKILQILYPTIKLKFCKFHGILQNIESSQVWCDNGCTPGSLLSCQWTVSVRKMR